VTALEAISAALHKFRAIRRMSSKMGYALRSSFRKGRFKDLPHRRLF
jgi:hypothetical protein